jgi:fumarate reductase subunit D
MKKFLAIVLVSIFPTMVFAANLNVFGLFAMSQSFIAVVLKFLIAIAVLWFVWNVFKYTIYTDEIKTKEARDAMIWGIIAIFVMVSIWGLVSILQNTFDFSSTSGPNLKNVVPTM